ncbi:MAG: SMC-Scp complex subunit ScpB [Nitrosarchaeum sp.]|nr:SMC-Scp complex subunit ScpB [Nitrosarchaeum sp.]
MTLRLQLEALLFASGKAMQVERLAELTGTTPQETLKELHTLKEEYDQRATALTLFEEGDAWKMNVREAHLPLVQRIVADTELLMPVMETLAVIAHLKDPMQADVVKIRGGGAYEHIAELVKLGFVTKLAEGRTYRLKLSEKFYEYFDIQGQEDIDAFFKDVQIPQPPPEKPSTPQTPTQDQQELLKIHITEEERTNQKQFLDEFEQKLATVKARNDILEEDETFKARPEPENTLTSGEDTILATQPEDTDDANRPREEQQ